MNKINSLFCSVFSAMLFVGQIVAAQANVALPDTSLPTVFDALRRDSFLEISIESNFTQMRRLKKLKKWQQAVLHFRDKNGQTQHIEVEIRAGGVSRQEICKWPPIKIRFPETYCQGAGLRSPGNLEIVPICQKGAQYEQYVLLEYAAYRLYNILTERSLRTQLLKLRLLDTDEENEVQLEQFAFLTEHPVELAERLGGQMLDLKNTRPTSLEHGTFDLACLFEFMVGNTDWYPYNGHNMSFMALPNETRPVPLIYDFDYSGFVGAPYAIPHTSVPIENVSQRYFMGLCRDESETKATIQHFRDKKADLLGFCQNFKWFSDATRRDAIEYLEDFYEILDDPKRCKKQILDCCGVWFKMK